MNKKTEMIIIGEDELKEIARDINALEKVYNDKGLKEMNINGGKYFGVKIILDKKDHDNWSNSKLSKRKINKINKKLMRRFKNNE